MNYIRHLTGFFDRAAREERLNPTHISLYMALFQFWNINRFVNPISISRSEMMGVSKICSKATYHKVIKELHEFGFILYEPSYNPFRGSAVHLVSLEKEVDHEVNKRHIKRRTSAEQVTSTYHTNIETSAEPINEPYLNSINILNSKLAKEQAHENTSSNFDGANPQEKKKNCDKRKREDPVSMPETLEEVKTFFAEQKSTVNEAEKFYNYFQSNGWKVGGRAPMKDWHAAARNWLLNARTFNLEKSARNRHHVTTNKDYGEPL